MKKLFAKARYLFKSDIKDKGKNNAVFIVSADGTWRRVRRMCMFGKKHSTIRFSGNNNVVELHEPLGDLRLNIAVCNDTKIILMSSSKRRMLKISGASNSGNIVRIGRNFNTTNIVRMELFNTGGNVTIGDDCLFAWGVSIRVGDGHVIFNNETHQVLNKNRDVVIGNHVWLASEVSVAKGSVIPDNSVVGMRALVAGRFETPNVVIAGVPAKVVKTGINWDDMSYDVYEKHHCNK